ncbi:MAG TPA: universal stress protein [Chloroflexota bacterium]|nr:universal stress protein [Chloroflexota bacterium]
MPKADRPAQPMQIHHHAPADPQPAMFRRLLVPLDGSRLAEAVLPFVSRLADVGEASVILLHVIEKDAPTRVHGERHLTNVQEADGYLTQVAGRLAGNERHVHYHAHEVPVGDVAESIAVHAEEHGIDLIILSTHGEGGIRDVLWGSIAQQVLQRCTRPVLLVRARLDDLTPTFAPQTIMVPLDATVACEAALGPAMALATSLNAQLRLVMVVPTADTVSGEQMLTATFLPAATRAVLDVQGEQAMNYLECLAAAFRSKGVPALAEVRRGETVSELASDTGEHADGLVVVATHGRAGLQAIWSQSVAARLLKRTRAPILLVPIIESGGAASS